MLHGQSIVLHADSPVAIEPGGLVSVSSGSACGLDILSLSSLWLQVALAFLAPCWSSPSGDTAEPAVTASAFPRHLCL